MRRAANARDAYDAVPKSPVRAAWTEMSSWERAQAAERRERAAERAARDDANGTSTGAREGRRAHVASQRHALVVAPSPAASSARALQRRGPTGWIENWHKDPPSSSAHRAAYGGGKREARQVIYDPHVDANARGDARARGADTAIVVAKAARASTCASGSSASSAHQHHLISWRGGLESEGGEEWPPRAGHLHGFNDDEYLWHDWDGERVDANGWSFSSALASAAAPLSHRGEYFGRWPVTGERTGHEETLFTSDAGHRGAESRGADVWRATETEEPRWSQIAKAQAQNPPARKMTPRRAAQEAAARHRQQASSRAVPHMPWGRA